MDILQKFREEVAKIDYSSVFKENTGNSFAYKSGLVHINELIENRLSDYTNQYFFEYSLLSSTINPYSSELYSFAAVSSSNQKFVNNIETFVNSIIDSLFRIDPKKDKIKELARNWFHNPELFLFPTINKVGPYICKDSNVIGDLTLNAPSCHYQKVTLSNQRELFVYNMSYKRQYEDMLRAANEIVKSLPDSTSLIEKYHSGVNSYKFFYDKYLRDNENDSYWFVSFPLLSAGNTHLTEFIKNEYLKNYNDDSEHVPGIGHFFLYFKLNDNIDLRALENSISTLFVDINTFVGFVSNNYTYATGLALLKKSTNESIKSAKAAIMSRNMSHNLGSHVMAYLKQHLSSVTSMLQDNVLTRLCSRQEDYEKLLKYLLTLFPELNNPQSPNVQYSTLDSLSSNLALPFLVGLGRFVSYLQERQDFIATISTDYIPSFATVNFKDSVYDELNPDKRYERHKDRLNQQLDNILLGNIARSEGLGRATSPTKNYTGKLCDIVLKYKDFDGNACSKGTDAHKSLEELRQLNVSLPGGIVGRQAIFSIIENIIRNAAKHSNWRNIGKLELTINKYDPLVDNIPDDDNMTGHKSLQEIINSYYLPASDINDLYILTLTDNTICSEDSLKKLRAALDDDYVDSSGLMKSANKGLKEMKISAAWLRAIKDENLCIERRLREKNDLSYIKENHLLAPIIFARISVGEDLLGHLQYIFCIPKPKVLAIVSDTLAKQCCNIQLEGCRFYTEEEFASEKNKSYELILCSNSRYSRLRPFSSARIFTITQSGISRDDLLALKDKDSLTHLLERLYRNLFGYREGDWIYIDDSKALDNMERMKYDSKKSTLPIEKIEISKDDNSGLIQGVYLKRGNVYVSDGKTCGKYIYRTHHDSLDQFAKFMDAKVKVEFVEGITGNNSSDRLIRNEEINVLWFYKHLYAMKQNVAIFDERLFSKITGLEEMDFYTHEDTIDVTVDNLEEKKLYYKDIFPRKADKIDCFTDPSGLIGCVSILRKAVLKLYSKGITATSYVQKKVFVFTFIQDADNSAKEDDLTKYYLIGISFKDGSLEYRDENSRNFECSCVRLAELSWSKDTGLLINFFSEGEYYEGLFDYLSIHQGLLDKLYEAFKIKDDPQSKDKLTKSLYKHFCNESVQKIFDVQVKISDKTEKMTFLSRLMIHSGRSKPGIQDMPQMLPFIQYAALEHAVMDCKYTLVELLDHAQYEQ